MAPKIAIIGAGPGGCMLARLLLNQIPGISVTIFEAEASINYRSQGGTLDLRTTTGLAALKAAGLFDEFQKFARYDGEALLVTDKNLTTWMKRNPRKGGIDTKQNLGEAPEIDRADLRRILIESLPTGIVKWDYKVSRVEETPSGLNLHFANNTVQSGFDLIVGCDGAFSKTRALLSSDRPFYTGLGGWTFNIPDAANTAPEVYKFVNRGSMFAYSDHRSLNCQQLSDGSLYTTYYGPYPEDFVKTCGFDAMNVDLAKAAVKKELSSWNPELLNIIERCKGETVWRNLYQLPVGWTWTHRPGVTLLGDAAHVMTPFAGIGVNTAFADALILSEEILAFEKSGNEGGLDAHIKRYEKKMFENAHKAQVLTENSKNTMLFTPGAPRTSIESWVLGHAKEGAPKWSHPFLVAGVYAAFWVYKWFV